jgi:4-hydroxy-tetrahydrodipicolinate reductase
MKVIVNGCDGRMGSTVIRMIQDIEDMEVVAGITPTGAGDFLTMDGYQGEADMVIDFSHHDGTKPLLDYCVEKGLPIVLCTTGQTEEEMQMIRDASKEIPIFKSANMSKGVALLTKLVKEAVAAFEGFDVEIIETHHNRKADAPSGTALMIGNAIKEVRPDATFNLGRSGQGVREPNEIGINAIRIGNVTGKHEVIIGNDNQSITLVHEAHDRALFADGAIDAAKFLIGKPAGMYDMSDLVG